MVLEQFEDRLVQILLAVAALSGVLSFFEDDPKVCYSSLCALHVTRLIPMGDCQCVVE